MSYTTPITDRVLSDVTTPTSKGYFNVTDWTRVYNNSRLMSALACIMLEEIDPFVVLSVPTIATIPSVANLNILLTNVETIRALMETEDLLVLPEIKDDWEAGKGVISPNYTHVNQWESTIDAIWDYWDGDDLEVCPSLSANLTVLTGQTAVYVDCIDSNGFNIEVQGTGKLYII